MRAILARLQALARREGGAAAVEFAIIVTVFLTASVGTVEFGRLLLIRNEMAYAADVGVREGLMYGEKTNSDIEEKIREEFASRGGGDPSELAVTFPPDEDPTNFRTFDLDYAVNLLIFPTDINLTVSRRSPIPAS